MDYGLKNVHALITGASGGIGLATAEPFLRLGAKVTAHYNLNVRSLETLASQYGCRRIQAAQANLTQEADVIRMFEQTKAEFGPVQVQVVNHAVFIQETSTVARMSLDQRNTTMNTNLTSSFLVVREYLRRLERAPESTKDKASIVLVGSTAGKFGSLGHADYSARKSGYAAMMYDMMLALNNEIVNIAPRRCINCVAPDLNAITTHNGRSREKVQRTSHSCQLRMSRHKLYPYRHSRCQDILLDKS